jgi:Protein of unknown function (DUF4238)
MAKISSDDGPQRRQNRERKRLDHILPQGYLEGFTNPRHAGNLSVYNCRRRIWFDSGTRGVCAERGFYDYSDGTNPPQNADTSFKEFEINFPVLRRELIANRFSGWERHLEFLLTFGQMLRARSRLFREHVIATGQNLKMGRIEKVTVVPSKTRPGEFDTEMKFSPIGRGAERDRALKNKAIMDMCAEIAKGPDWMGRLNWCIRLTRDPTDPVITADDAIIVIGHVPTLPGAFYDHRTRVFFPICWQACLVGSHSKIASPTGSFEAADLTGVRSLYLNSNQRFAYSPVRLT